MSSNHRNNLRKHSSSNPLQRYFIARFHATVRSFANKVPKGDWCEAGCGEGFVLRSLLDQRVLNGVSIQGIDLDETALRFAANWIPEAQFQKASVYEMPFRDKQFQCVMMLEVLEHLEFPEKAVKEACRVGHYLLLSVPHEPFFRIANFLRGKNWSRWGNDEEHIQWWGCNSFRRLLEPYGEVLSFKTSFPWIIALLRVRT